MSCQSTRGQQCTFADHPDLDLINEQLLEGVPLRTIQDGLLARHPDAPFVSTTSLSDHRFACLKADKLLADEKRRRLGLPARVSKAPTSVADIELALADLEGGRIGHEEALSVLLRDRRDLWRRPDFKALRKEHIGDRCEQCGTTTPPLVLQHLKHPRRYEDVWKALRKTTLAGYRLERGEPDFVSVPFTECPCCPRCGSPTFYRRAKMTPTFRCGPCAFAFDEPGTTLRQDYLASRRIQEEYDARFIAECGAALAREATLIVLRRHLDYFSGKHVRTFCKKCAYMMDEHRLVLCPVCRKRWCGRFAVSCWECQNPPSGESVIPVGESPGVVSPEA